MSNGVRGSISSLAWFSGEQPLLILTTWDGDMQLLSGITISRLFFWFSVDVVFPLVFFPPHTQQPLLVLTA